MGVMGDAEEEEEGERDWEGEPLPVAKPVAETLELPVLVGEAERVRPLAVREGELETERLREPLGEREGVSVVERDCVPVAIAESEAQEGVTELLGVAETQALPLRLADCELDVESEGRRVAETVPVLLGEPAVEGVAESVSLPLTVLERHPVEVGVPMAVAEGHCESLALDVTLGLPVALDVVVEVCEALCVLLGQKETETVGVSRVEALAHPLGLRECVPDTEAVGGSETDGVAEPLGEAKELAEGEGEIVPPTVPEEQAVGVRLPGAVAEGRGVAVTDTETVTRRVMEGDAEPLGEEAGLAEGRGERVPLTVPEEHTEGVRLLSVVAEGRGVVLMVGVELTEDVWLDVVVVEGVALFVVLWLPQAVELAVALPVPLTVLLAVEHADTVDEVLTVDEAE